MLADWYVSMVNSGLPVRHQPTPTETLIATAYVRGCTLSEACTVLGYAQGGEEHRNAYEYLEACRDTRLRPGDRRRTYITDYHEATKEAFERLSEAN